MSDFINTLISRHTNPAGNVKPRPRSRFESAHTGSDSLTGTDQAKPEYKGMSPFPLQAPDSLNDQVGHEPKPFHTLPVDPNSQIYARERVSPYQDASGKPAFSFNNDSIQPPLPSPAGAGEGGAPSNQNAYLQHHEFTPGGQLQPNRYNPPISLSNADGPFYAGNPGRITAKDFPQQTGYGKRAGEEVLPGSRPASSGEPVKPAAKPLWKETDSPDNKTGAAALTDRQTWIQDLRHSSESLFNSPKPPAIYVTIGRIEVRASVQAAPAATVKSKVAARPQLSLEEYLKQQNGYTP